jgi:predicted MFS family arabinose efflux permease
MVGDERRLAASSGWDGVRMTVEVRHVPAERLVPRGLLRRALIHRDVRLLLASVALGQTGHLMCVVALSVYVFQRTGSPDWVSAVVIARGTPVALFSALAGSMADRWEHRRLLLVCTNLNAGVLVALTLVMAWSAPTWTVIPLVAAGSLFATPLTPAVMAYLPAVVPEDDLVAANTAREAARKLAQIVGPAGAGLLIATGSPGRAVMASAGAMLLSALCVAALRTASRAHIADSEDTARTGSRGTGLRGGVTALRGRPGAVLLLGLFGVHYFVLGFEHVLYTVAADRVLGLGADGLGYLFAAIGLGGVTIATFTGRLANTRTVGTMLTASIVAVGVAFTLIGWAEQPVIALALLSVVGAGGVVFHVLAITTLQRVLARGVLGRVAGLRSTVTYGALLAGSVLAPVGVALLGLRGTFLACGLLLVASAVASRSRLRTLGEAAEARRLELAPRVALLERLQLFDGAQRPTLEALAAELVQRHVAAGQKVVRQGEVADRLYLIDQGRFAVVRSDDDQAAPRLIATLGPGEYFGEIGLLHDIPRIATVQALDDAVVFSLSGARFASTLVGGVELSADARATIDERMAPHRC